MTWTVDYNQTLLIIEVTIAGRTTRRDLQEITSAAIALSKTVGNTRFLIDATEIKLAVKTIDLYNLPAEQYVAENLDRKSRLAPVLPKLPKEREDAEFYETACINRGWNVKAFPRPEEATAWLTRPGAES